MVFSILSKLGIYLHQPINGMISYNFSTYLVHSTNLDACISIDECSNMNQTYLTPFYIKLIYKCV